MRQATVRWAWESCVSWPQFCSQQLTLAVVLFFIETRIAFARYSCEIAFPSREALSKHVCKTCDFCNRFHLDEKSCGHRDIRTGWRLSRQTFAREGISSLGYLERCANLVVQKPGATFHPQGCATCVCCLKRFPQRNPGLVQGGARRDLQSGRTVIGFFVVRAARGNSRQHLSRYAQSPGGNPVHWQRDQTLQREFE